MGIHYRPTARGLRGVLLLEVVGNWGILWENRLTAGGVGNGKVLAYKDFCGPFLFFARSGV